MRSPELRRVFPYLRPFRKELAIMVFGAVGAQVLAVAIPVVMQQVIDGPITDDRTKQLVLLSSVVLALGVLEGALLFLRRFVLARAATTMEMRLRADLYAHLQRLSLSSHGRWPTGQLLSRAMADANVIFREFVSFAAVYFVANLVTFAAVGVLLFRLDPVLAAITMLTGVPVIILGRSFQRRYRVAARRNQDAEGDLGTFVEEAALGVRVITAFGREGEVAKQFSHHAGRVRSTSLEAVRITARFEALLDFLPNVVLAVVVGGGAFAVAESNMTLGGLAAFLSLLLILIWPVQSLGEILSLTHQAVTATSRIDEVFTTDPEITDKPGAVALHKPRGELRFEGVSFRYGPQRPVLDGLDLHIEPGETLAVVGRTGSGKSTLCALVPRLLDVAGGRVTIDGIDVRDVQLGSLRRNVGVAFEDALLFSASVRENLVPGDAHLDDDELLAALEVAHATFVLDLPWGLDTRIGEQGLTLSGGQRQRLALARAVVAKPPVLVLDDPLSALDVTTEAQVHAALERVVSGTTTLITAHRPSTVALADRVAFVDEGRVVATGPHSHLLQTVPEYRAVISQEAEAAA